MVEEVGKHKSEFNEFFFEKLFSYIKKFWWIAAISSVVVFSLTYFFQYGNHRYESATTIHRWYDPDTGVFLNHRAVEVLFEDLLVGNAAVPDGVDIVRVQTVPDSNFLRVSALAPTPEKAAEALNQSLAQLIGYKAAETSVSGALKESAEKYSRMLQALNRSLDLYELRLADEPAGISDPGTTWIEETMGKLLLPVESDVINLRSSIQEALKNVEDVGDRKYGFGSENVLLAPTIPSSPVPSNAAVISVLAAIAAVLVAVAFAVLAAATTAISTQGRPRD